MYYRGKSKTREYLDYQNEIRDELMGVEWPFKDHPVSFHVNVGLSSPLADLDNVFKPFFDTLQAIYEDFNDKKVYYIEATKQLVKKGDEYIAFSVSMACTDLHSKHMKELKYENKLQ